MERALPASLLRSRLASLPIATAAPFVIAGWVAANYAWTCWFGFVNDDYVWVEQAAASARGLALQRVHITAFLRPVIELSFLLNYLVSGSQPFGYHLVNLMLETLNAYLVYRLVGYMLTDRVAGLLAAALFVAHPSHAGAVTWVCGRTELIADAFYLGAVLCHLGRRTAWAAGLFGLALLSKENAVSFPLLALALDQLCQRDRKGRAATIGLYLTMLAFYIALRVLTSRTYMGYAALNFATQGNVLELVGLLGRHLIEAVGYLLEPAHLSGVAAVVALSVLALASLWLASDAQCRRTVWLGILWMPITLLPFLGFMMLMPRYGYLPGVGLVLLLVSAGRALLARSAATRWPRLAVSACAVVWLVSGAVTLQRRNEQLRRNSVMSGRIIDALARAVPHPAPGTLFVVDGLGPLRLARDPWAHTPVLLFGLADAIRLRFDDASLDVAASAAAVPADGSRPVLRVVWDAASGAFVQ